MLINYVIVAAHGLFIREVAISESGTLFRQPRPFKPD